MLAWTLQRNIVVLPKSANKDRLEQNLEVLDVKLAPEDMKEIEKLEAGVRLYLDILLVSLLWSTPSCVHRTLSFCLRRAGMEESPDYPWNEPF